MSITQSQNRNEVKNVKFHHKVKRFYHKNLFRKIYTVAIIGLIGANVFSMVKYSSFADELEGLDQAPVINQVVEDEEIIPDWLELGMDDSDLNEISTDISPIDDKDDISTVSGEVVEDLSGSLDEVHLAAPETDKEEIKIQATEDNPSNLPANRQYGTITLVDQYDPTESITIMDRNLGATTNDITDKGSYGWYYQHGRNYGFPGVASCEGIDDPDWDGYCPMNDTDAELFDDYDSNDYNGDVWYTNSGPCPDGWHVIKDYDFEGIIRNYGKAANITVNETFECSSIDFSCGSFQGFNYNEYTRDRFLNYLKLPLAGYRSDNLYISSQGNYGGYYRTSSKYRGFTIYFDRIDDEHLSDYYGAPVRCVSDSYENTNGYYTVTFYDGENNEPFTQYVAKNQRAIQPEAPEDDELSLDEPQNRRYIVGWNTSDGKRYDFSTPVTSDLNLYAEWVDAIRYEDGYIKVFDGNSEIWLKNGNQGVDPEEAEKFRQVYELLNGQEVCFVNESLGDNYGCNEEGYAEASRILGV